VKKYHHMPTFGVRSDTPSLLSAEMLRGTYMTSHVLEIHAPPKMYVLHNDRRPEAATVDRIRVGRDDDCMTRVGSSRRG
jgi:hypothetical protein